MNTLIKLILLLLSGCTSLIAQPAALWPEPMEALVEYDATEFEVYDDRKAKLRVERIIHIFNDRGKKYTRVRIRENKFTRCKKFTGKIMGPDGAVYKRIKKDDFEEDSFSPDELLYVEDSKNLSTRLSWHEYPYKIKYEYELEYKTLYFWPPWIPQEEVPVLKSSYKVILHDETVRFNTHNAGIDIEPVVRQGENGREFLWELTALEPFEQEDYNPFHTPKSVWFTPVNFVFGDYRANFDSWDGVAKFYADLSRHKYQLPPEAKTRVQELTADCNGDYEKIATLYYFLQNYTRYVAIFLNIGGWQPHSAESIYLNKYGDCKDLSLLMISMLKEAGITAYPALTPTKDRRVEFFPGFPSDQFNHVIACAALPNDTLWLECTADYLPAGELPPSVEGVNVLLVKERSGELIRLPRSSAAENSFASRITGRLNPYGQLEVSGSLIARGNQANYLRGGMIYQKPDDCKHWLRNNVLGRHLPQFTLDSYSAGNVEEGFDQPLVVEFEGSITNFAGKSASRLFFNPNILNRVSKSAVPDADERTTPVYYRYAFRDADSIEIDLPSGYVMEAGPLPQNIETHFAHYQTTYTIEGDTMKYCRSYHIKESIIPPEQYGVFKSFLEAVSKNDDTQFVFKKL